MNYKFDSSFVRDVKKVTPVIHKDLGLVLQELKSANTLIDISNVKKLAGYKTAYRIKVNSYRLCFFYGDDKIMILARFLPRKEVYRFFP